MVATYQANPDSFEKNMNLLRAGAVLRLPDAAQLGAVSTGEALSEVRRQYAAGTRARPRSRVPRLLRRRRRHPPRMPVACVW